MKFSEIVGKTLKAIDKGDGERITFDFDDGTAYASYHSQDCCESVSVQRIEGDIENVIGSPIIAASESHDDLGKPGEYGDSWTWTQQRIRTANGEINIVWLGESNGYYGETPYFCRTHEII